MNKQTNSEAVMRDALKMAIKALLYGTDHTSAVKACKEASEYISKTETTSQPAQEPVAWMELYKGQFNNVNRDKNELNNTGTYHKEIPLYTHPAPSWQGLSVEDWAKFNADFGVSRECMLSIEQALKEKNHGS